MSAQVIGFVPKDHDILFLTKDRNDVWNYNARFLKSEDLDNTLCGVRGNVIIALAPQNEEFVQHILLPFIVAGMESRKNPITGEREFIKDESKVWRNDFGRGIEPEYYI